MTVATSSECKILRTNRAPIPVSFPNSESPEDDQHAVKVEQSWGNLRFDHFDLMSHLPSGYVKIAIENGHL
jgi:hypothetical protein